MSFDPQRPEFLNPLDSGLRAWRRQYYNPEQLHMPDSTLDIVLASLDSLISGSETGRCYSVDGDGAWQYYGCAFMEKVGERTDAVIRTQVEITDTIHGPKEVVREELHAELHYGGTDGAELFAKAYQITRFAGGIASMEVQESLDGVSAALVHQDPSFRRAVSWRSATEYDATVLFDEVQRLQAIQQRYIGGQSHNKAT